MLLHSLLLLLAALHVHSQVPQAVTKSSPQDVHYMEERPANIQQGNIGNEFYIGFMKNFAKPVFRGLEHFILNQSTIYITTTDPSGAVVMIESEQGTSTYNVNSGATLSTTVWQFKAQSGKDRNKGLKIKAEQLKQISVFTLNEELHSVDGFTALPCSHIPSVSSYEYYAVSVPPAQVSENSAESAFLIVACSDNTTVAITPTQSVQHPYIPNFRVTAGVNFTATLQERETLYIQSPNDLTGSKVVSTTPISFFTGHECGNVPANVNECDHLVEQIPPTVTWGTQFILASTATRTASDMIKAVASEDNTEGTVSCVGSDWYTERLSIKQAGTASEYYIPPDSHCFVEFNKPVLLVQFTSGRGADNAETGDPFMVMVPAVSQYVEKTTFSAVNREELRNYINVFVPAGLEENETLTIIMDNEPIDADWMAIPCYRNNTTCGYAAQVAINGGMHSIWNSDGSPFGVIVYGFTYLNSYAYVGGLNLFSLPEMAPPTSHFVFPGSSMCLPCRGGENSLGATVAWTKDGQFIPVTERQRLSESSNGSLCIMNTQFSDAGNYTCHQSGLVHSSTLSVIGGIIVGPPSCNALESGAVIGIGQGTTYLDSNTEAYKICCRVQGPTGYRVNWLLNGNRISSGQRGYEFGEDFMHYSGPLNRGCITYTCEVVFPLGLPKRSEVSELCIGDISPPTVVNIIGETRVLEHSSVTHHCSADGVPVPTKMWTAYRDTKNPLPATASDDGDGTLKIIDVTEMDGTLQYCCDVGNKHGDILSKCITIDVLISPEIVKHVYPATVNVSVPYGAMLPLEKPRTIPILIGQNGMIPETYNLQIDCNVTRGNPEPLISWFHNSDMIYGPQYRLMSNGTLVIENLVRGRDDGVYTCAAYTPNIGRDSSTSSVTIIVPPLINSSDVVNSPGNCLDLTDNVYNTQRIGVDLCLRAGERARLTLICDVVDGIPAPTLKWFKDGKELNTVSGSHQVTSKYLTLELPSEAYGAAKEQFEGNYTCVAYNTAGTTTVSSYITLFGDITNTSARTDIVRRWTDIYVQFHKTISEHFPGVENGNEYLMFITTGKVLSYDDFNPGYLYDESEESVLPQTMENMFDLVDVIPDGGSIVFNPYRAPRLQNTYSELVEMLQVAPSSISPEEQQSTRRYFQDIIQDPGSGEKLPRLSLYLLYKNTYYMTKFEVENLIDSQRKKLLGWEFTQWYERNIHQLQMKINDAYVKWDMYADKTEVELRLESLNLEDHSQEINSARALLLASQRMSRFKDEKEYYLVKFYPDTWYKALKNRVGESIEQMQFRLTQLKTKIQILEITSKYLEKETRERDAMNVLLPSQDPVYQLYRDLDVATYLLEEQVKESEDMRYKCIVSGNPADCHLYWGLRDHIHDEVLGNYTEFYWYVHSVQAALNHREYSIPAISNTISSTLVHVHYLESVIRVALSELSDRDEEEDNDNRDFFTEFMYHPTISEPHQGFELPPSLIGRLLWYINPESVRLLPKELINEYNLTINHLNAVFTNVSAKLSKVSIHRRWFKSGLFGNKHLQLVDPDVMVSPGDIHSPEFFRETIKNGTYHLPLYPSSLLLATDIELTVDVPFIYHTLPTLIKLSYDPHVTGGFGPFSFGSLHRARAGNMKFRVGIRDSEIIITLPGTQLIGYVCDVVPQHPKETVHRIPRSVHAKNGFHDLPFTESNQWLLVKKSRERQLFQKDSKHFASLQEPLQNAGMESAKDATERLARLITPTAPLDTATLSLYDNSTL